MASARPLIALSVLALATGCSFTAGSEGPVDELGARSVAAVKTEISELSSRLFDAMGIKDKAM